MCGPPPVARAGAFVDAAAVLRTEASAGKAAVSGGVGGLLGGAGRKLALARLAARAGGSAEEEAEAVRQLRAMSLQVAMGS